jgi:hypothetical protein
MDQVKLEALLEAALEAQRELSSAAEGWEHAKLRLAESPSATSEEELTEEIRSALRPEQAKTSGEIKTHIVAWAGMGAAHLDAEDAHKAAGERLQKSAATAHFALERVVALLRQSTV